jgi:hypothetical protein
MEPRIGSHKVLPIGQDGLTVVISQHAVVRNPGVVQPFEVRVEVFFDESPLRQDEILRVGKHISPVDDCGDVLLLGDNRDLFVTVHPTVEVCHIE